jgi:class 3 adenylate cyclase
MSYREFHYCWEYELKSSAEKLWPFVANTNRFNRDTRIPAVESGEDRTGTLRAGRKRLRLKALGLPVEWEESPFEWVRPSRIGSTRTYYKGPVASITLLIQLAPRSDGGTKLTYEVWARPKNPLGLIVIPLQLGVISARRFARAFREYDRMVESGVVRSEMAETREVSEAEQKRLDLLAQRLVERGVAERIANKLVGYVGQADDLDLGRIRPYALADGWSEARREVLEACFHATRIGLLDLQWDLLCPMCRGPQETSTTLRELHAQGHCVGCQIDFDVNFDRFVEVTFRPNAAVRDVEAKTYCVSSPERTPHVIAQQLISPRSERTVSMPLEAGRYRIRAINLPGEQPLEVRHDGPDSGVVEASTTGWACEEIVISTKASLKLINNTDAEQLFVMERTAWSDQAATAAEVTALQIFRDLFSTEALRPGEQISVGTLTVLFTDLRNSTQLYRQIGDATAFGRVLGHFDILKQAIAEEDGAIVKTIGDAVMAVFRQPAGALRAMLKAQQQLAFPAEGREPLTLKAGMHVGPCIAVTLNDRLDYFGSTVNLAARLEALSTGSDVIVSRSVFEDPAVRDLIEEASNALTSEPFEMTLKGFVDERFELVRVGKKAAAMVHN